MATEVNYMLADRDYENLQRIKDNELKKCKRCDHTGFIAVQSKDEEGWNGSKECKCLKRFKRYKRYYKAKIPRAYWKVSEDNFYGDKKALKIVSAYMDNIKSADRNGLGLLMWGTNGNGKTSLACIMLMYACDKKYSAFYTTLQNLLNMIMDSFKSDDQKNHVRDLLVNVDFLVVDEVGKEHIKKNKETGTVFGITEFEEILRHREGMKKPTFIVSNSRPQQMEARYGISIGSLFQGTLKTIEVTGVDTRKTVKQQSWDKMLKGKS